MHDFEADLPNELVAAIEVTSQVDELRPSLAREAQRHLSALTLPASESFWLVWLDAEARVRAIKPDDLLALLSDLEASGSRIVTDMGDYRNPLVMRIRKLGIQSVRALTAKTGHEGTVLVEPGTFWGFGWDGPTIDGWLQELFKSNQGVNKLHKLRRAVAAERHLVIVLDWFSKPGIGVSLALTARQERAAANVMPSIVPPEPLTHLWLLPLVEAWEALYWVKDEGWRVLAGHVPTP